VIARGVVQALAGLAVMAAMLFAPAGTVAWPQAWVFLAEIGGCGWAIGIWLARHDPGLLAERMASPFQRGQPLWDQVLVAAIIACLFAWLAVMALDAARWHLSHIPLWAQALGAAGILVSMVVNWLVFRANSYAAPVVRIQEERGHRVATGGPYRYVRHPMYGGMIFFALGTPLLLGSWYGLALAPVVIVILAVRAVLEERALAARFADYAAYAARVRYRLIPMLW